MWLTPTLTPTRTLPFTLTLTLTLTLTVTLTLTLWLGVIAAAARSRPWDTRAVRRAERTARCNAPLRSFARAAT